MPIDDNPVDGSFDDAEDSSGTDVGRPAPPPSPDDRLWRHPSEMGGLPGAPPNPRPGPPTLFAPSPPPELGGTGARRRSNTAAVAAMAALAGSAVTLITMLGLGAFRSTTTPPAGVELQSVDLERNPDAPVAIAQKVLPAVGRIEVRTATGSNTGTAVTFRSNGYMITTADLVDGAEDIAVVFGDQAPRKAVLTGSDRESDIAVIKVEGNDLPVAVLGRSSNVQLGEPVLAIDTSTLGSTAPSIPVGVVNALGRRVEADSPNDVALYDMLQTNLLLTSRATGTPLINAQGAVVGVVTDRGYKVSRQARIGSATTNNTAAGRSGGELTIRFATPIDYARQVADSLIRPGGKVEHAYLGAAGEALSAEQSARLEVTGGVTLTNIADNSPAANGPSPLEVGDVIVKIQDEPITSWDDLVVVLRKHRPGDTVAVWFLRPGHTDPDPAILSLSERPGTSN